MQPAHLAPELTISPANIHARSVFNWQTLVISLALWLLPAGLIQIGSYGADLRTFRIIARGYYNFVQWDNPLSVVYVAALTIATATICYLLALLERHPMICRILICIGTFFFSMVWHITGMMYLGIQVT